MTFGIREFSHATSRVIAKIREGHVITLTDHGKPIAVINPIAPDPRPRPSIGVAHSGDPSLAARVDEVLAAGFGL